LQRPIATGKAAAGKRNHVAPAFTPPWATTRRSLTKKGGAGRNQRLLRLRGHLMDKIRTIGRPKEKTKQQRRKDNQHNRPSTQLFLVRCLRHPPHFAMYNTVKLTQMIFVNSVLMAVSVISLASYRLKNLTKPLILLIKLKIGSAHGNRTSLSIPQGG
jgi:hypothetical protein